MHLEFVRSEIERMRVQVHRQRGEIRQLQRAGIPAASAECQSAFKFDPASASNFDPFGRRVLAVALAPSELVGVAETVRARVVV